MLKIPVLDISKVPVSFGPTKHRKELQGTENSAKNYKVLQGTTRYFQTKHKVAENNTRYF